VTGRPLRISIIVPGRWHAFDLARELNHLGYLQQLITSYPKRTVQKFGIPDQVVVSLPVTELLRRASWRLPLPQRTDAAASRWMLRAFASAAARRLDPCEVVVAWSGVGRPAFRKASAWAALRVCERGSSHINEQESILAEEHRLQGLPWTAWGRSGRALDLDDYAAADIVSIPSLFVRDTFIKQGFPEDRLLHSPYGVDLKQFRPGLGSGSTPRVAFAGALGVRKGVGYLLEGFRRAELRGSELWLIGGRTRESGQLLGDLDDNVRLWGHVPQGRLAELYGQCSAFVLPSVEEGLALVQAQALACGLPLICTTNTGGEDLLRMSLRPGSGPERLSGAILRFPAGYLVPIRRPDLIARSLRDLYMYPGRLADMRAAAIATAAKAFTWAEYAQRLVDGYREAGARLGGRTR
jgi:glycosyltransferase involved in cell wall biosynthesis